MKKLVLVATLFMFVCGGTFLVQAKKPAARSDKAYVLLNDTVVTDSLRQAESVPETTVVAE